MLSLWISSVQSPEKELYIRVCVSVTADVQNGSIIENRALIPVFLSPQRLPQQIEERNEKLKKEMLGE